MRIYVFILVLLLSLVFAIGEPMKNWNPNVNTGDIYHDKYEVVPVSLPRIDKPGQQSTNIFPLDYNKALIYIYI